MFEDFRLLGTPENRIVVQTKLGNDLDAIIGPEPSQQCLNNFEVLRKRHGMHWIEIRKPPSGGYNCAGMVWAVRRAHLPQPSDWQLVLDDDGYRRIGQNEAKTGDIVVYVRNCDNEISHIGRICRMESLFSGSAEIGSPTPRVLSKWDVTSGECIHAIGDVHLDGGETVTPIVYTDR
jgi:hypothetical protein